MREIVADKRGETNKLSNYIDMNEDKTGREQFTSDKFSQQVSEEEFE